MVRCSAVGARRVEEMMSCVEGFAILEGMMCVRDNDDDVGDFWGAKAATF